MSSEYKRFRLMKEGYERTMKVLTWCIVGIVMMLLVGLLAGCKTKKTIEKSETSDSVRIEYREKIVKVPVNVIVEVPVEKKVQMDRDSSHLETSFAVSEAKMVWIDGVLFLRHSLENKPQKIEKTDSVQVKETVKTVFKTRRVTYNKTIIKEKRIAWWQKALMYSGVLMWLGVIILILIRFLRR